MYGASKIENSVFTLSPHEEWRLRKTLSTVKPSGRTWTVRFEAHPSLVSSVSNPGADSVAAVTAALGGDLGALNDSQMVDLAVKVLKEWPTSQDPIRLSIERSDEPSSAMDTWRKKNIHLKNRDLLSKCGWWREVAMQFPNGAYRVEIQPSGDKFIVDTLCSMLTEDPVKRKLWVSERKSGPVITLTQAGSYIEGPNTYQNFTRSFYPPANTNGPSNQYGYNAYTQGPYNQPIMHPNNVGSAVSTYYRHPSYDPYQQGYQNLLPPHAFNDVATQSNQSGQSYNPYGYQYLPSMQPQPNWHVKTISSSQDYPGTEGPVSAQNVDEVLGHIQRNLSSIRQINAQNFLSRTDQEPSTLEPNVEMARKQSSSDWIITQGYPGGAVSSFMAATDLVRQLKWILNDTQGGSFILTRGESQI